MEICLATLCLLAVYFISKKININVSEWLEILAAGAVLFLLLHM